MRQAIVFHLHVPTKPKYACRARSLHDFPITRSRLERVTIDHRLSTQGVFRRTRGLLPTADSDFYRFARAKRQTFDRNFAAFCNQCFCAKCMLHIKPLALILQQKPAKGTHIRERLIDRDLRPYHPPLWHADVIPQGDNVPQGDNMFTTIQVKHVRLADMYVSVSVRESVTRSGPLTAD